MAMSIRTLTIIAALLVVIIIALCCWCTGAWKNMYECCRDQNIEMDARYQLDVERRRRELEVQVEGEGVACGLKPPPYAPSGATS